MNKRTILITGATDGIGKHTATGLAKQDTILLLHGRNKEKLDKMIEEIKTISNNPDIEGYLADLSSLDNVRLLAKAILKKHDSLDVLVNNAGAGFSAPRYGKDGIETRLTVNYLAPFLLTRLLLPAMKKASSARVVNVSSAGQCTIDFDDLLMEKNFDGATAYCRSKLALIMFTIDLAEETAHDNITVNALHPGTYLDTNMVREAKITPMGTAQSGAEAEIYLATSPELKNISGKYFNVMHETRAHKQAYDINARKQLKELTGSLVGIRETTTG